MTSSLSRNSTLALLVFLLLQGDPVRSQNTVKTSLNPSSSTEMEKMAVGVEDTENGNNSEANATARSCLEFLRNYLPKDSGFQDSRVYLKLVSDENAEYGLSLGKDKKAYRSKVQIAYLIVWVPTVSWVRADHSQKQLLPKLQLKMLKSLYPRASLFVSVFDGEEALVHSSWRYDSKTPSVEVL